MILGLWMRKLEQKEALGHIAEESGWEPNTYSNCFQNDNIAKNYLQRHMFSQELSFLKSLSCHTWAAQKRMGLSSMLFWLPVCHCSCHLQQHDLSDGTSNPECFESTEIYLAQ